MFAELRWKLKRWLVSKGWDSYELIDAVSGEKFPMPEGYWGTISPVIIVTGPLSAGIGVMPILPDPPLYSLQIVRKGVTIRDTTLDDAKLKVFLSSVRAQISASGTFLP